MKKWISWFVVAGWMGVIFYLSHQPSDASSALSSGIVHTIIQVIEKIGNVSFADTTWMHVLIRKGAHVFAYFLLAILLMHACMQMEWKQSMQIGYTLSISVIYAISDEIHQLFISGRSGEMKDVLIDTFGATLGILFFIGMMNILTRKTYKKSG